MRQLFPLAFAALLIGVSVPSAAHAAGLKVGVVDVEYVIVKSKSGKAAKAKLKKIFDKKQKELDAKQEELLKLKKQLENPSDMETPERRRKNLAEYQQGLVKLQEEFLKHQQELQKREMELMKPILKKLETILTDYAKTEGFDMLLTRGQHGVLFAKPEFDVTEEILSRLDAS